ncbi:DUF2975 domain-containing protein [Paenibacillus sp. N1-5-1-14]|uniref:DUF2975 domain-containing protein n=1 Tax=Paenibacillus radicibacter TaxID=2972488 RepID=UPI002158AB98|nr:DUF2975 domain-containing protein [Paenibacillus radicibacter]MCR8643802.1 DUF2975 domain-containing protein [Paenibacillus radicibacter]
MKHNTLFLKIVIILMGLPVLALCIFGLPAFALNASEHFSTWVYVTCIVVAYLAAIPFYIGLYQAYKLLCYIDKNNAFSELSVRALRIIKYCASTVSFLYLGCLPFIYYAAQEEDAPGLMIIGVAFISAPLVIAVFAAVLQKLLKNAIDIKSENDLTV